MHHSRRASPTYKTIKPGVEVILFVRLAQRHRSINSAIELHDSEITSIVDHDGTIVLELASYLHQSPGRPGIDPGTGWTQNVRLTFLNATLRSNLGRLPDTILDGRLALSDELFENVFSVPSTHVGSTCLQIELANEISLTIRSHGFQAECVDVPTYVEQFNP